MRGCSLKVKLNQPVAFLLPINLTPPRSCPSRSPVTFSPHSKPANTIDRLLSVPLLDCLSLSPAKSPSKSYRGNSQQKIDICLVNSLTTIKDTVSLMIKALMESIYAAEEAADTKSMRIDNKKCYFF